MQTEDIVDPGYTAAEKASRVARMGRSSLTDEKVDSLTAERLLEQLDAIGKSRDEDWHLIGNLLEKKSETYSRLLAEPRELDRKRARFILRNVFATRRRADDILSHHGLDDLLSLVEDLLHGDGDVQERFDRFVSNVEADERVATSLASELLHFTSPEERGLWARWTWNPESQTGAAPLLTGAGLPLDGDTPGHTYLLVEDALREVEMEIESFSLPVPQGTLGVDVLTAAVHCSYTYLTLAMRMGKEFTDVIPDPPTYVARLLGVHELYLREVGR